MSYHNAKVYSDGSHHIAIPQSNTKSKSEKKSKVSTVEEIELKEKFEQAYAEAKSKGFKQKSKEILDIVAPNFEDKEKAEEFVNVNMERKKRNKIERDKRLSRKLYTNDWNYFVTFTYDDKSFISMDQKLTDDIINNLDPNQKILYEKLTLDYVKRISDDNKVLKRKKSISK